MTSRSLTRWALEANWAFGFRQAIAEREARIEQRFVDRVASSVGFDSLKLENLSEGLGRERSQFFILGSSSSVEEISDEGFETIGKATSVGINAWVLHSFVPNLYAYEPVPNAKSSHFRTLSLLDRPDVLQRSPQVLFLRPRNSVEASQLNQIPPPLQGQTYLYGRISPYTRRLSNVEGDVGRILRFLGEMSGSWVALDSGATIVRMACLALVLGYKQVVFVGVDLNHTEYFWEKNPRYLFNRGIGHFDSEQRGTIHETELRGFAPFVASEMILALSEIAKQQFDAEFLVASSASKLADFLPTFSLQ